MGSFKVLLLLFTVAVVSWPMVAAQPSNFPNSQLQEPSVSPAMAIIIVVLVAALFFVAFFSIYVRHRNSGESIGQTLSMRRRNTVAAARGLEASVIEATFPTFTYAEVKDHHIGKGALECAVCLNEFEDAEMLRLIPKCDHVFHPECIDTWLKSHVTCPVCRADLTSTDPQPDQVSEAIVSPEEEQQRQSGNLQQNSSDEVSIRIESDENPSQQLENQPEVKRNLSSKLRSFSIKWPKKFRSHSTGHSLVVPGENLDRYTLRLPENVRKEVMNRALLNRAKSCAATLPRYGSARRGYRSGSIGRSFRRIERSDQEPKSDRWVFKMAPPFFTRGPSMKSPKVVDESGEGSTSQSVKTVTKMPSFRCLEPRDDEPGLLTDDSAKNPV